LEGPSAAVSKDEHGGRERTMTVAPSTTISPFVQAKVSGGGVVHVGGTRQTACRAPKTFARTKFVRHLIRISKVRREAPPGPENVAGAARSIGLVPCFDKSTSSSSPHLTHWLYGLQQTRPALRTACFSDASSALLRPPWQMSMMIWGGAAPSLLYLAPRRDLGRQVGGVDCI